MKNSLLQKLRWMIPLLMIIWLEWFKRQPEWVERYYAQGIYPTAAESLRKVLGKIPFSVGDVLVAIITGWLVYRFFRFLLSEKPGKLAKFFQPEMWGRVIRILMYVYILFHVCWGFNYYRLGSAHLLQLTPDVYTTAETDTLVNVLQQRLHRICADSALIEQSKTGDRKRLGEHAVLAYQHASNRYPFMAFRHQSLKPILLGRLQAYFGYAGYLFPFTGEAQVDFFVPNFTLPFTVCHEMAHQLGFGTESEANLIGFMAARESDEPAFVYSAYAGVHKYALSALYQLDSLKARAYMDALPGLYLKDRKAQQQFLREHESFLQPMMDATYTLYLQGNNQPQGLESYNRVVAWLIAYGKKYGWEKL